MPENFANEPQYGDQTQLSQAGLGQKELPISQGARPERAGGRPAGAQASQPQTSTGTPQDATAGDANGDGIPDDHRVLIRQYIETRDAAQRLAAEAQKPGNPMWVPFYAQVARINEQLLAHRIKTETPDFDLEDPDWETTP
jgi:hypothetical protein